MAKGDSQIVREFKAFGMRHIREQLAAVDGHFVDKAAAYKAVVAAFKAEYGWPPDLTEMERTVGGKLREVYINRLHWMTARLCREGVIESVTNRPFIALAGHLAAAEAAYGAKTRKRREARSRAPALSDAPKPPSARRTAPERNRDRTAAMPNRPAKKIVEDVLGPARTRALWTANYYPALPFTPQSFEVGALLPTMLYMARFGHRRGKGRFAETFVDDRGTAGGAPTIASVARVLAKEQNATIEGFDDEVGQIMLGDLLLSWCLENKNHEEGQDQQIQRVLPTHYFSSWIDLPGTIANLRGIPELLTGILANQPEGAFLYTDGASDFPVRVGGHAQNPLLELFGRYCEIRGTHASDYASDYFAESGASDIGIDQLLAVRLADACGHAPDKLSGDSEIANWHPLAISATSQIRENLAVFFRVLGPLVPQRALLQMLEPAIGLGLLNLTLSSAKLLFQWEQMGHLSAHQGHASWPLFVDASQGQDETLRDFSEASVSECLRRFERVPIILMLLRLLDDRVRNDRRLADDVPSSRPDSREFLNLLGAVYKEQHARSGAILDRIFDEARQLAEEIETEVPDVATSLRRGSPWDMAESLCELMGRKLQMTQFLRSIESMLLTDRPNGLAIRRRVSRTINGRRRTIDVRSIILSSALLDFLVHRHLYESAEATAPRALSLQQFLRLLREDYGLYVDREPPGQSIPSELLRNNKAWLERRLRDLGLLIGVNDAESMKQLRPRYSGVACHGD